MAASRSKRTVKPTLNPVVLYQFPNMDFPVDFEPRDPPPSASASAKTSGRTPLENKKKSDKSSRIQEQIELERLKQQNLQLEREILSKKGQISSESLRKQQAEYKACGQIPHDQSQEKNPRVTHE